MPPRHSSCVSTCASVKPEQLPIPAKRKCNSAAEEPESKENIIVDEQEEKPVSRAQQMPSAGSASRSAPASQGARTVRSAVVAETDEEEEEKKDEPPPISAVQTPKYVKSKDEAFVCPICFDNSPELVPLSLDCKHLFCSGCWTAYLTSKINDEGEHCIRCVAEGCALVAPDAYIQSTSLDPADLSSDERKANSVTWA
ncbi:hypothetical protein C8J56DRAFT_1115334 [Mycena floridula]|nr:hypothetical protein C8J56DRAFT_1115334 [Mycena floridula]